MFSSRPKKKTQKEIDALELEYLECICRDISRGIPIDPNIDSEQGNPPIVLASKFNRADLTSILLKASKIDVNCRNNEEETALIVASANGHEDIVKLLLGSDKIGVNSALSNCETALSKAIYHGHIKVARMLLNDSRTEVPSFYDYDIKKGTVLSVAEVAEIQQLVKSSRIKEFYRRANHRFASCHNYRPPYKVSQTDMLDYIFSLVDQEPSLDKKIRILGHAIKTDDRLGPFNPLSKFLHESGSAVKMIKARMIKEKEWATTPTYGSSTKKVCMISKISMRGKDFEDYSISTARASGDLFPL